MKITDLDNWRVLLQSQHCKRIKLTIAGTELSLEVANTHEALAKGLMGREYLPPLSGMIFVYRRPRDITFWMKNTPLSLDMIFLDHRGVVSKIHPNAKPFDLTPIFGGFEIQYIIEIASGETARLKIKEGDKIEGVDVILSEPFWKWSDPFWK